MRLPNRLQAGVVLALASVLILTACTANAPSASRLSIPDGVTGKQLCDVVRATLAPDALPGVKLGTDDPTDQDADHECLLRPADSSKQLVGVIVTYGKASVAVSAKINKGLTDSSANSKEQCPGGASVPTVSGGLPTETTIICNRKLYSLVNYLGGTSTGTIGVTVNRAISKGKISASEVQRWVAAVAAKLLVSTSPSTAATGSQTLEQISGKWSEPAIPTGFAVSGPQKTIKTIQSQTAVFSSLDNDPCQVATTGVPIQSFDKTSDSSFEFMQTLASTKENPRPHAVLFVTARAFGSHQEAMDWMSHLHPLVDQCESKVGIGPGYFTANTGTLIRWAGDSVREVDSGADQLLSGFILVAGNAVFYGSAISTSDEPVQPDYERWLTAAEQSCRDSVS